MKKCLLLTIPIIQPQTILNHGKYFFQPTQFGFLLFGLGNVLAELFLFVGRKFFKGGF